MLDLFEILRQTSSLHKATNGYATSYHVDRDEKSVSFAKPGYEDTDFDIEILGGKLYIKADIKKEDETPFRKSFSDVFTLNYLIDTDAIEASYKNGILTIKYGLKENTKKIKINS